MRVTFFTLAVVSVMAVTAQIVEGSHPLPMRLSAAASAVALIAYWGVGLRRARFAVLCEPLEVAALFLILRSAPGHPLLPLCGLMFRCLYGGLPAALWRGAAWSAAVLGADIAAGRPDVSGDLPRVFALMLVPGVMVAMGKALERVYASEQRLSALIEHSNDVVTVLGADLIVTWQARSLRAVLGHDPSEWLGSPVYEYIHPHDCMLIDAFALAAHDKPGFTRMLEVRIKHVDGTYRWCEIAASNQLHDRNVHGYVLNIRDATDRLRLEEERHERELAQEREATHRSEIERLHESLEAERVKHELQQRLQRAQRLESVGQVAGGVAHDFNNLLMIIHNYVTLVRDELPEGSQGREDIDEIGRAAERGGRLTRQLLAFARRKPGAPELLDVDEVITGMRQLLDRPLGKHIELQYAPQSDLWPVEIDRADLEQIVLNLIINSRDALAEEGGWITVTVDNVTVSEELADEIDVWPGRCVRLAVADNGCGIDPETLDRVWEPFFTTKGAIEGSGLGLATVHGVVHHAGGGAAISSVVGEGTTVEVFLPVAGERGANEPDTPADRNLDRNADRNKDHNKDRNNPGAPQGARILLVETDAAMREATRRVLESVGHDVLAAGGADEALALLRDDEPGDRPCELLLTNLIMPSVWGDELAARVNEIVPDVPTLYLFGHGERFLDGDERAAAATPSLAKPFSDETLLRQVADMLDAARPSDQATSQPAAEPSRSFEIEIV